jgi:hypothetical protein
MRGHDVNQRSTHPHGDRDEDGPFSVDLSVARLARIQNYLVGGDANFAVDRAAAEEIAATTGAGLDGMRGVIEAMDAFMARAVGVLAGEAGVRQFLYIGMPTPATGMIHDVAWQVAPAARVVYVSHDATTLAHVHALGRDRDGAGGTVAHVYSSFDDPQRILDEAAATLDLGEPVAVLMPTTLNLLPSNDVARHVLDDLYADLVPGSYLVLVHTSLDLGNDSTAKMVELINSLVQEDYLARGKADIAGLLSGLELLEPGLVPMQQWRRDAKPHAPSVGWWIPMYGAVARKP